MKPDFSQIDYKPQVTPTTHQGGDEAWMTLERIPVKSFYDGLQMWHALIKDLSKRK